MSQIKQRIIVYFSTDMFHIYARKIILLDTYIKRREIWNRLVIRSCYKKIKRKKFFDWNFFFKFQSNHDWILKSK